MAKIHIRCLLFLSVLTHSAFSSAALIQLNDPSLPASSDGFNITLDTSTGLEWLDVAVSAGRSYDDLSGVDGSNEFIAGGDFAGFRYATFLELDGSTAGGQIDSLFKSAGLGVMQFSYIGGYTNVKGLIDYVGCSGNCADYGYALGTMLNNTQQPKLVIVEAFIGQGFDFGRANNGNVLTPFPTNTTGYPIVTGNWLVRSSVVPVPPAIYLFASGVIAFLGFARRQRQLRGI